MNTSFGKGQMETLFRVFRACLRRLIEGTFCNENPATELENAFSWVVPARVHWETAGQTWVKSAVCGVHRL